MYKINFALKQHTPLIHFQHNQEGATLRATEVKPKLDRFLIQLFNKQEISFDDWLIKGQKKALDYKVRITEENDNPKTGDVEIMPSNIEKWIFSKRIFLLISSLNFELINKINKNINLFFCKNNFGKRQTKGFGCFYPENLNEDNFLELVKNDFQVYKYKTNLKREFQADTFFYNTIISQSWSRLKSGKNFHGYEKSRIFKFLIKHDLRWDKRWIKKRLKELIDSGILPADLKYNYEPIDINDENIWEDVSNEEYRFGRALIGLAEHYEYRAENGYLYQVIVHNKEVERYGSPVTFKIFKNKIYAVANEVNKKMFDQPFDFKVKIKKNNKIIGVPITIKSELRTPKESEFKLTEFLDIFFTEVGFDKI